jgi:3-hydroxymyristoyl/3-hydroxydecanoyl-(acyl carrier protein) dehydratase
MTHVKMRSFIPPGAALDMDAELAATGTEGATIRLSARIEGKIVATARLDVTVGAA